MTLAQWTKEFHRGVMVATSQNWPLNSLLVFLVAGWIARFVAPTRDGVVFSFNFLALIPLSNLLCWTTDELSKSTGETLAALLNVALGNFVELIVAILALAHCQLTIVQSSLIGSVLSNLLLVLGMSFFVGGLRYYEQGFQITPSQVNSGILVLGAIAFLVPGIYNIAVQAMHDTGDLTDLDKATQTASLGMDILKISRGISVILLFVYIFQLVFALWTHSTLVNSRGPASEPYRSPPNLLRPIGRVKKLFRDATDSVQHQVMKLSHRRPRVAEDPELGTANALGLYELPSNQPAQSELGSTSKQTSPTSNETLSDGNPDVQVPLAALVLLPEDFEEPKLMRAWVAVVLLVMIAALVATTAEFLVGSINGIVASGNISQEFVGMILLPFAGNAAEHFTAVTMAWKDKRDMSISIAVGSAIQITHLVIPLVVIMAWCFPAPISKPLSLLFDPLSTVLLFLSVLLVNHTMADAKSNWLEGWILMTLYVIIALIYWYYPGYDAASAIGLTC
ncbi:hypothetical protein CALCODRAFT_554028 [Calocera cornea HHB12733]|uniref:Sodium/calcium exchanger membrane region domain-containing protein n=1 Tax=Calocera cornea HHB12733 TaxID=1353952 RepID=A0A165HT68_9BASI|nr:hypothetical protein CALCODRAFT_554028 [Calocera cornea HHB12733]